MPEYRKDAGALTRLSGVGPQLAKKLTRLGIHEIRDLLFHLPFRYQDRTKITPISELKTGTHKLCNGHIIHSEIRYGRRRSLLVLIADDSGEFIMRLFHFNNSQINSLQPDRWIQCFGEARFGPDMLEMVHPEYRLYDHQPEHVTEDRLTPVYPTTEGVSTAKIRSLVAQAWNLLEEAIPVNGLPASIEHEYGLMPLAEALSIVHQPPPDSDIDALLSGQHPAQQRLALEELLAHHLALFRHRLEWRKQQAPKIVVSTQLWPKLCAELGFQLTNAQDRVIEELIEDLTVEGPTLRLIQGDVGSGKTVVAAAAALTVIESSYQTALMVPTELLVEQHKQNFYKWFHPLGINVGWLTSRLPAAQRRATLARIADGSSQLIIGTHALFQSDVNFHKLGLIIIDEQHRFGVDQRLALREKGMRENEKDEENLHNENNHEQIPHQVIMSATPIPRSLAMIFYADLDVSNINELPPGRKPVTTVVMPESKRNQVIERIDKVIKHHHQVYWVCPLIDESESLQAQAANETASLLKLALPARRIELIHGRLKPTEKDDIMLAFKQGDIDLLVATTIIEVGVDVANANLMIIESAERLGLAQLHQLRGRVGRGGVQATCVLLYRPPLGHLAKKRLGIMRNSNDGFEIARLDLENRGPGEVLGTRQTGLQQLRVADLRRDRGLMTKIESIAVTLRKHHPQCIDVLIRRWLSHNPEYANV